MTGQAIECFVMITVDAELYTLSLSSRFYLGGFAFPPTALVWLLMLRVIGGASLVAAVSMFGMTPSTAGMKPTGERVTLAMPNL